MPDNELRINTTVDASGVQSGVDQTVDGLQKVEAATDATAEAAKEAAQASAAAASQSAQASKTMADGAGTAADATQNLGEISGRTAATLAELKISEEDVAASAQKVGSSLEVTARAMIQIKSADLSDEIAKVREQLQALGQQGSEASATVTEGNESSIQSSEDLSAQLEWLGDDLTDNKEKGAKMVEEFGSMRESRRLAIELFESFQGGGETIAGVTGILRTFLLTSEALNPELAAITAIGLALTGVIALHGHFGESTKDADEATKAWTGSLEALNAKIKELSDRDVWGKQTENAHKFTEELSSQETNLRIIQAALDRLEDAKFGAREALLNKQEQAELQGKSGTDADEVKLRYDAQRDQLRAEFEQQKAERALKEKQDALDDIDRQIKAKNDEIAAADANVQKVSESTQSGATGASLSKSDYEYARDTVETLTQQKQWNEAGYADRETGNLIPPLSPNQWIELQRLTEELPNLRQREVAEGPQYTQQIKRKTDERDALQKQESAELAEAQKGGWETDPGETEQQAIQRASSAISREYAQKFADLDAEITAMSRTQQGYAETLKASDEALKTYKEGQKDLDDLRAKRQAAQIDVETANVNAGKVQTTSEAATQKDANAQVAEQEKIARDNRDKELEARIRALEARLETTPPAQKPEVQSDIERLNEQKAANRREDELKDAPRRPAPTFETQLGEQQEKAFQEWFQQQRANGAIQPDDSGQDYDFRGAFRAGTAPGPNGHWPDRFKKPNHETFSDESEYATGEWAQYAGHWKGDQFEPPKRKFSGEGSIDPASRAAIDAEYQSQIEDLQGKLEATTQREEKKDDTKDLTRLAGEATAAVKASQHPELEEELKNMLAAAKNDPQAKILALLQVLSQTISASHNKNSSWIAELEKELHDLQAQVNNPKR